MNVNEEKNLSTVTTESHASRASTEYRFQDFYIPERMMGGIRRYIDHGIPPGDFLTAIVTNDLSEAVGRADDENMHNIPAYVSYFYNEAPRECWGSQTKMDAWLETKFAERQNQE